MPTTDKADTMLQFMMLNLTSEVKRINLYTSAMHIVQALKPNKALQTSSLSIRDVFALKQATREILEFTYEPTIAQNILSLMEQQRITKPTATLEPSAASKAGKHFNGPGGEKIYSKGRRITPGVTTEGQKRRISWEVCPVKKPLISVARLSDAGNKVTMSRNEAYITNKRTGEVTHLRRVRNTWVPDMWIRVPKGFTRQAP